MTSGELAESAGGTAVSKPISESEKASDARSVVALVKKVVFEELQFFPTNSTIQSGMCVKPKNVSP